MINFEDLGLAKPVARAVATLGYKTPSPIQEKMIPTLLEGNDAIGIAQTGTGKTAAFMLPLLTFLAGINSRPQKGKCDVLVLTPTRELASQIIDNARSYGRNMKFASALIVGGARYEGQLRALAKGVNLIVATPGRLIDHIETGAADLSNVSYVVLDEADQMLDMGFVPAVREIMKHVPDERQTVLTSATMPKPIEKLANELLKSPKRIAVSRESEPAKNVKQDILFVDKPQKPKELLAILDRYEWSKVIIFTRTKRGADKVQVQLIKQGVIAQSLHGDKSFGQRRHIMDEFKSGEVPVLVATDLAGRGLDIDDISLVINYDMPNIPESYVHRIGRTGRAGRSGIAISLVDRSEKAYLKEIEALMGMSLAGSAGSASAEAETGERKGRSATSRSATSQWAGKPNKETRGSAKGSAKGKTRGRPKADFDDNERPRKKKFERDQAKKPAKFGKKHKDKARSGNPSGQKRGDAGAQSFDAKLAGHLAEFEHHASQKRQKPSRSGDGASKREATSPKKPRTQKQKAQRSPSEKAKGPKTSKRKGSDRAVTGQGRLKRSANFKKKAASS